MVEQFVLPFFIFDLFMAFLQGQEKLINRNLHIFKKIKKTAIFLSFFYKWGNIIVLTDIKRKVTVK